jgi:hypothetical protein
VASLPARVACAAVIWTSDERLTPFGDAAGTKYVIGRWWGIPASSTGSCKRCVNLSRRIGTWIGAQTFTGSLAFKINLGAALPFELGPSKIEELSTSVCGRARELSHCRDKCHDRHRSSRAGGVSHKSKPINNRSMKETPWGLRASSANPPGILSTLSKPEHTPSWQHIIHR